MILSCEVQIPSDTKKGDAISLGKLDAILHRESVNGFYPTKVLANETAKEHVVHNVIKSCMKLHSVHSNSTPWQQVEQRLKAYEISHQAMICPQPYSDLTCIDIVIL